MSRAIHTLVCVVFADFACHSYQHNILEMFLYLVYVTVELLLQYLICIKLSFLINVNTTYVGIVNNDRRTPLEVAVAMGNQDVVKYFHSVDVNSGLLI